MINPLPNCAPAPGGCQAHRLEGPLKVVLPQAEGAFRLCIAAKGGGVCSAHSRAYCLTERQALILPPADCGMWLELGEGALLLLASFTSELLTVQSGGGDGMWMLRTIQANVEVGQDALRMSLCPEVHADLCALAECLVYGQQACRAAYFSPAASGLLCSLLELLVRELRGGPDGFSCCGQTAQIMRECVAYIDTHYAEPLSTGVLARRCMMSETNFRAFFSRVTGMPLKKYLNGRRIRAACELLRDEEYPLQAVAFLVGYEDLSTFYRNFSKLKYMTPAQYRGQFRALCRDPNLKIV